MTDAEKINPEYWINALSNALTALKSQQPLVHYISNSVAANYVANVLLAAGASPALIDNPYEAAAFAQISASLNINLGTPSTEQMQAMRAAATTAHAHKIPWVLDPVGYGPILTWRSAMVDELLAYQPSIIRGNASEISALAGHAAQSKGVDSTMHSHTVATQVQSLLQYSPVIAISGVSDFILLGSAQLLIQVHGGSHLQPKVTATGCALGALIAAYAAVAPLDIATVAAHNHFAIAGKLAYLKNQSVGSFNVAFLDAIEQLDVTQIEQYSQLDIQAL